SVTVAPTLNEGQNIDRSRENVRKLLVLIGILVLVNVFLFTKVGSNRSEAPIVFQESGLRLRWDGAPDPRIVEYRIYVTSEEGNYTFGEPTAVVPVHVTEWSVDGLPPGRYFAFVTAATPTEESPPTDAIEFHVP
ncbi:MAG: fibronectin type III domain-containing protein, partial [Vicinamibacteria bacterium]